MFALGRGVAYASSLIPGAGTALMLASEAEILNAREAARQARLARRAVFVPLAAMLASPEAYAAATTEVFGPLQVVTEWRDGELPLVLQALERMDNHLTAGVVSNDPVFINSVVGATVNGTTYVGLRARTTGAPQNHW